MPSSSGFEPILSAQAAVFLSSLPKSKQRKLVDLLFQLAKQPDQLGDYPTFDETGRTLQNLMVGQWHFTFWPDHSCKEFRIVEIVLV